MYCGQIGFALLPLRDDVEVVEAGQRAGVVLQHVVVALDAAGVRDLDGLVVLAEVAKDVVEIRRVLDGRRIDVALHVADFRGGAVAEGAAGIAGHEDEVARVHALGRNLEDVRRVIRHVVLREVGRLAVLADVRAEVRPVAGVARPHPVVGLAAEVADAERRRVDEADVLDLHLRGAEVLRAFEERGHAAADAARLLALVDELLDVAVDRFLAVDVRQRRRQRCR